MRANDGYPTFLLKNGGPVKVMVARLLVWLREVLYSHDLA